jgi:hypothetical protein
MNAKVVKSYTEMKKSQEVGTPEKEVRKKQAAMNKVSAKAEVIQDAVKEEPVHQVSFNVTDMQRLAKRLKLIADKESMEEIEAYTESLKICTFDFMVILNSTRLYNKEITKIKFVEAETILVIANGEEYIIKFRKRFGRISPMFMVRYSDNLNGSVQDYNYRVAVDENLSFKVNLESVVISDADYSFYGGGKMFKFHLQRDDVEYDIMINSEKITCDPAKIESYISTLVGITSLNASGIYRGLVYRFGIKPDEAEKIAVSEVSISRDGKPVSQVRFVKGKLERVLFTERGATFTLKRDGTWRYRRGSLDVDHERNIYNIWYNDSRIEHEPIALGKLKKFIRKKQISFFGAPCNS